MTDRSPIRDRTTTENAQNARLAVEALFEPRPTVSEKAADVEVVVRRRRSTSADRLVYDDGSEKGAIAAVRAPRVFKIEKQQHSDRRQLPNPASHLESDEATSSASDLAKLDVGAGSV